MSPIAQINNIPVQGPLKNFKLGGNPDTFFSRDFLSIVITRLLPFAILASGLYFFLRLVSAGYQYLTSVGDSGKIQAATKELTNASIGFVLVISAYFIAQLLEILLGINIL